MLFNRGTCSWWMVVASVASDRPCNMYWSSPVMDTASSTLHLAMANDIAIGGARHCESTCNCWKDTSDDCSDIHISEVESIDDSYQLKVG